MFADTSEQAHPSDYIYVLTAMCSRLHPEGTAETIILALRKGEWVRGALRLFGSGLMSSHLDLVFARAPQIVQFFLPQLMHLALLPTSDRGTGSYLVDLCADFADVRTARGICAQGLPQICFLCALVLLASVCSGDLSSQSDSGQWSGNATEVSAENQTKQTQVFDVVVV